MISKETICRFLKALYEQYEGSSTQYFFVNPYNEKQHLSNKLSQMINDENLNVGWARNCPNDVQTYDVSNFFDMTNYYTTTEYPELYRVGVYSVHNNYHVSLDPSNELFLKMAELFIEVGDDGYYSGHERPTDVITIDDMSFTIHDILCAIDEYSVPDRLNRHLLGDMYVPYKSEVCSFRLSPRYSDEFIEEVETVGNRVYAYSSGTKSHDYPERNDYITWDDIIAGDVTSQLSEDNVLLLMRTINNHNINKNIPALTNIVDLLSIQKDKFVGIMLMRALTQALICISFKDVPKFQTFVRDYSLIMREIRCMH